MELYLQFVLKHDEWSSLREVDRFPSSMCPSNPGSLPLVKSLIRQIVSFHPDIQYLHIGADEIWHMGLCSVCTKRVNSNKGGKSSLFLEHVVGIAQYIKETYPCLKIIMWDDMLRSIDLHVLNGKLFFFCRKLFNFTLFYNICMQNVAGYYNCILLQNTILANMWNQ